MKRYHTISAFSFAQTPRLAAVLLLIMGGVALQLEPLAAQQPVELDVAAPELVGGPWLNTPNGRPISLAGRKGKVTIVQFWTFGCINCQRNLPAYRRWHDRFAKRGVAILGVHTPETPEEKVTGNVVRRVRELGIPYPVLLDQQGRNWNRWSQQYWPTIYLLDRRGRVRYRWAGELEYQNAGGDSIMTEHIEELLAEK